MAAQEIPSPVGGWNARDALSNMDPTDAVTLVNWVPGNGVVTGRGGSVTKLSVGHAVETLIPYEGDSSTAFLAAYNGHIYDVSDLTTPVSLASGFTVNLWQFSAFDDNLVLVNGTDASQRYDGTTISALTVTQLTTPTISGIVTGSGTLAAATYYYKLTATNSNGETVGSAEVSHVLAAPGGNVVSWTAITGATGYKLYRSTSAGAEIFLTSVGAAVTYTDDGSITPSGSAPPSTNTTGPLSTVLYGVVNFKGRAFYWEKNAAWFWYALAGSFQGQLYKFDLSNFTQRGGYIVQIVSWTRDSGDGVDNYCAFIFNTGECIIYQGSDPQNALAWAMVGHYQIGRPLGVRAHAKFQSTEVILTDNGFVTLDEMIGNVASEVAPFGGKIVRAAKRAAQLYGSQTAWQPIFYPGANLFVVNIPLTASQATQYVRNTNTGAWTQFTGWASICYALFDNRLYFGTSDGKIVLAYTTDQDGLQDTFSDDGVSISYEATTAYLKFGQPGLKTQLTACRVVTTVQDVSALSLNAFADYKVKPLPPVDEAVEQAQGMWDVSFWDEAFWPTDDNDPITTNARPSFRPVQSFGFANALNVRYRAKVQNPMWYSTEFVYNQGGIV